MKKALSVALACSMALSLVACGGGSKPTEAPTTAAAGDTTTAAAADTTAADTAAAPEAGAEVANMGLTRKRAGIPALLPEDNLLNM